MISTIKTSTPFLIEFLNQCFFLLLIYVFLNFRLLFFEDYHDSVEEAQEAKMDEAKSDKIKDETLLDLGNASQDVLEFEKLDLGTTSKNGIAQNSDSQTDKEFEDFFSNLVPNKKESSKRAEKSKNISELEKSLAELDLAMDSFSGPADFDFPSSPCLTPQAPLNQNQNPNQSQPPLEQLTSENIALLNDILNGGPSANSDWDSIGDDTFLAPGILKQSLGDACLPTEQKKTVTSSDTVSN